MLGAFDLEVFGDHVHGRPGTLACDRVPQRAADVEMEWVAVLIRLVLVGTLVPESRPLDLVPAGAVLEHALEQVAERALTDAAYAFGRQLHAAFALLDQTGFFELLGEVRQLL